jgi:tetratricopeptide (TPR) repeat protein
MRNVCAIALVALAACAAPDSSSRPDDAGGGQGVTPLGVPMAPLTPDTAQGRRIRLADEALAGAPDSLPLILEAASAREAVWRYAEAVALYRRAAVGHPQDWRLALGMGHRLIRLRRSGEALAALERSLALDPEGFNAHYLLGLARYVRGDYPGAVEVYQACLDLAEAGDAETPDGDPRTCRDVASDPASRVALTSWMYRALRRAGRHDEAARLVAGIPEGMEIPNRSAELYPGSPIPPDDNTHYYLTLMFYRGLLSEEAVLSDPRVSEGQWPTVAYGVAVLHLVEGDTARAVQLLDSIAAQPYWARLGHVAAEADLLQIRP